jgi:hypothetical protein
MAPRDAMQPVATRRTFITSRIVAGSGDRIQAVGAERGSGGGRRRPGAVRKTALPSRAKRRPSAAETLEPLRVQAAGAPRLGGHPIAAPHESRSMPAEESGGARRGEA